jgi:hypothetical protein
MTSCGNDTPDQRVLALSTRLSPTVRHPFRWHFGPILERCGQALVETKFPFTAPLAESVVFAAVSSEVFWPWMLGRYLWPATSTLLQAMEDRTSTLATLAEDSCEFTRLLPCSDLMDTVLRGDEAAMRNPVLNNTVELAHSLWPNCNAWPAGAMKYYTVRPHATGPGSTPYFWGGELEAARLLAMEATVQGMALDAGLQADHQAPDDMALFNVVATHMPYAPLTPVI